MLTRFIIKQSLPILSENVLAYWDAVTLIVAYTNFLIFLIESLNFIIGNKYHQLFSLK